MGNLNVKLIWVKNVKLIWVKIVKSIWVKLSNLYGSKIHRITRGQESNFLENRRVPSKMLNIKNCPKLDYYLKLEIRVRNHLFLSKFEKKVMKRCSVGTSKAHLGFFFLIKLLFFGGRFPFVSLKSRYEYKRLLDSN